MPWSSGLIPTLTGYVASDGGQASSYNDYYSITYNNRPWKAFNGSSSAAGDAWVAGVSQARVLTYQFLNPTIINKYIIAVCADFSNTVPSATTAHNQAPISWSLAVSNDGQNWTTIKTMTNQTIWYTNWYPVNGTDFARYGNAYEINPENNAYKYYQFFILDTNKTNSTVRITELQMYKWINTPSTISNLNTQYNNITENITVSANIDDIDIATRGDMLKYYIKVNGTQVYPSSGYTSPVSSAISVNLDIDKSKFTQTNNTIQLVSNDGTIDTYASCTYVNNPPVISSLSSIYNSSTTNINFNATLTDSESKPIKYYIKVNGIQAYPSSGYSGLVASGTNISVDLDKSYFTQTNNTILIYANNQYSEALSTTTYINHPPTISGLNAIYNINTKNVKINANLSDVEGKPIKYKIKVNGIQAYPNNPNTEYTTPVLGDINLSLDILHTFFTSKTNTIQLLINDGYGSDVSSSFIFTKGDDFLIANIKKMLQTNLPTVDPDVDFVITFTDENRIYATDASGNNHEITNLIRVSILPSSNQTPNKLYANTTDKSLNMWNGTAWESYVYTLPIATAIALGGVKQGSNVTISADGTLTANTDTTKINKVTTPVLNNLLTMDASGNALDSSKKVIDFMASNANTDAVTEGTTNKYYTDTRARASISGTTPIAYNNITGAVSILKSDATHDGYLAQTDFNTFNGKQSALGFTAENSANKGIVNGYAGLGSDGKVVSAQLPTTVTNVSSTTTDIAITNGTTTPALTLNTGIGANQIVKVGSDGKLGALDATNLINVPVPAQSFIGSFGSLNVFYSETTLATATNTVNISIAQYVKSTDGLLVFIGSTLLSPNLYNISTDGLSISKITSTFSIGTILTFICLKPTAININTFNTISNITVNSTLDNTYHTINADATSGIVNLTLPTAVLNNGLLFRVMKIDASSNNVVINTSLSQLINGLASQSLTTQYSSKIIISNGTNWFMY